VWVALIGGGVCRRKYRKGRGELEEEVGTRDSRRSGGGKQMRDWGVSAVR
jgi:hypothetical protein